MSYSCCDFVDTILDILDIEIPDKDSESPSAQADYALAAIRSLQAAAKGKPAEFWPQVRRAKDLRPGDQIDLENDEYADAEHDDPMYACELCLVAGSEMETPDCLRIDFEGSNSIGVPPDHLIAVHGHDEEYAADAAAG